MSSASTLRFLVVEDEPLVADRFRKFFAHHGEAEVEYRLETARNRLDERWSGILVDVALPDGSGLTLLAEYRNRGYRAPVLVLTGKGDTEVIAAAQLYGAHFLHKPPYTDNLRSFVEETQYHARLMQQRLSERVDEWRDEWDLTRRESQLLLLASSGVPRNELAEHLDVEDNTVKTLIRRLIRKSGAPSLGELVSELHRSLFLDERSSSSGTQE